MNRATAPTTVLPVQPAPSLTHRLNRSSRGKTLLAVGVLIVIGVLVAGFFYFRGRTNKAIESVAVLPFENKSGNADSEYLSDGLAESLIYRLSQLSNLEVTPRSSAFRYKGAQVDAEKIGNELGVDLRCRARLRPAFCPTLRRLRRSIVPPRPRRSFPHRSVQEQAGS